MKKLLLLFACLFTLQAVVRADNDKPVQVNQLPQQAQQFIKQHFADSQIAMAKVESDPGAKILKIDRDKRDYEVKLSNKWELKFDLQFNLIGMDD